MSEKPEQNKQSEVKPIWAVSARVRDAYPFGPGGLEIRNGTKKFRGKQKVYYQYGYWGMGGQAIIVIGRYRGKYKYISCAIRSAVLTDFRPELVYSPTIIEQLHFRYTDREDRDALTDEEIKELNLMDGSAESKEKAEALAKHLSEVAQREFQILQNRRDTSLLEAENLETDKNDTMQD